jgi:hypothetical protein
MFSLWFGLLGGSFVFLDVGPSILILVFPLFVGCFSLFIIGRVSPAFHKKVKNWPMNTGKNPNLKIMINEILF